MNNNNINNNKIYQIVKTLNTDICKPSLYVFYGIDKLSKPRAVQWVPSEEEFADEVNKVIEANQPAKSSISPLKRRMFTQERQRELDKKWLENMKTCEANCRKAFFKNRVITSYLLRKEFDVGICDIPVYSVAERKVYDFPKLIDIPFRNPDEDEDNSIFRSEKSEGAIAYRAIYKKLNLDIRKKELFMLAYNFLGVSQSYENIILEKNKKIFDENKLSFSSLSNVHLFKNSMDIKDIASHIYQYQTSGIVEYSGRNIFIFQVAYDGHMTCLGLSIDFDDLVLSNSHCLEVIMFDSDKGDTYAKSFIKDLRELVAALGEVSKHSLDLDFKFTYISYGAQIDDTRDRSRVDHNCAFYAISVMNALIRILASSSDTFLKKRLLSGKELPGLEKKYIQELRGEMPEYFRYYSAAKRYIVRSYEERQDINGAKRWYLGRRVLKQHLATEKLNITV